jgi:prepilin-type N-terminal cleavage/methylation domain-containing protein
MERINQKGFGLIEVMMTLGISSVIALGLATMLNNAMLVSQTADTKASLTSIVASEAGIAFTAATCTTAITLTPQAFGGEIQFDTLKAGASLTAYNLTVKSVTYANPSLVATAFDGTKVYYGTITLVAKSNRAIYGGQTFAPRVISATYLTVNPTGQITQCGSAMPPLPQPIAPVAQQPSAIKTFDFDADPAVCENFPVKARCGASQTIVVESASYGSNCGGVPTNYGMSIVQALCNGQSSCDFTAGNVNNCTSQGVFVDPALNCPKSFHMAYYCQ